MRLYGGDIVALRAQFLGNLAHMCNCPPPCVDALRCNDFFQLILYIEDAAKRNSKDQ